MTYTLVKKEAVLKAMYPDESSWSSGGEHMKIIDEDSFDEIPEVEAIPVWWIQKRAEEKRRRGEAKLLQCTLIEADTLEDLIEDWEKERMREDDQED